MHFPYTDRFPDAVALAGQSVGVALTAVVWHRPLGSRAANVLFCGAIWLAALCPSLPDLTRLVHLSFDFKVTVALQASATLATLAILLRRPVGARWFGPLAALGQFALYALGEHVRDSNLELAALYLMWCGLLLGVHA